MAERPKFIVSVYLKGRAPINLYYKTKEAALNVGLENLSKAKFVEDDFCNTAYFTANEMQACLIVDLEANMKLQSELALMQAKQNVSTQSRARSDPALQIIQGAPGVGRPT